MNNDATTTDHGRHPEELLATYVAGEASEGERTRVETLLSECTECRREVEFAVQARAALQSLPELNTPELRIKDVSPSTVPPKAEVSPRRGVLTRVREWSWERIAWGAGLVAAGSLVALFVLVQSRGEPFQEQAAQGPGTTAGSDMESRETRPNYTPASLDALARQLGASQRALAGGRPAPSPATAATEGQQPTANVGDRARDCLRRGGGLRAGARPVYVEEAAFRRTSAFVGAFESGAPGGGRYLVVLAVDSSTCDALYVITRSL